MNTRNEVPDGAEHRTSHQDESWNSHQLNGQEYVSSCSAGEVDGAPVYEMANKAGRA